MNGIRLDQRIDSADIQAMCVNGTNRYLSHLKANNSGLNEIGVHAISIHGDNTVLFKLSSKIFDLDTIVFRIRGIEYNTRQIKVVEYDIDENLLTVRPDDAVKDKIVNLEPHDVLIVSDLKFLVQRVLDWYTKKGDKILFERHPPVIDFEELYLPNKVPSPNQIEAIRTIYGSAFSYVWGAPGTGKTQYVMAYCLLNYIRQGKRVVVLAPTNNAIEQVLRGVIDMTDVAGVDRERIIRLGAPRAF